MTDGSKQQQQPHSTILIIHQQMPTERTDKKLPEPISVESRVRDMIDCIESGYDSSVEWIALNKFYDSIRGRKDGKAKNLIRMIEPVMAKYGQHGVAIK